ncbi:radical SAM protein [Candidatus Absconditicoccus praedator]|uniref:radical SAM protein n=1 Tax=Candidatus Absconditicoccus praedator TaxID=2735562 RepID=UPI001E5799F4|nr:radical SAM protein [Candidatus Absconditicoccus praedator]UFX83293.1 radical SAM protein [Candidatus Absconditicoccus praedator]
MKKKTSEVTTVTRGIEVELTSICSLNCEFCIKSYRTEFGNMDFDTFSKVVDFIKFLGCMEVDISGVGDIFQNDSLYEFIDHLFEKLPNIDAVIPTKGQDVTMEDLKKIKSYNDKGYNITLMASVIYLTKWKFDKFVGRNQYEKFVKFIDMLRDSGVNFSREFVILKNNLDDFEKFKKLAEKIGKEYGTLLAYNFGGNLSDEIHKKYFDEEILRDYFEYRSKEDVCEVMKYDHFFVDYKGDVYICANMGINPDALLGNINDVYHDFNILLERKQEFRKKYHDICNKCFFYKYKLHD